MAAERPRMVSLPGDSASSDRAVNAPYSTAASAQTSATMTPWSERNSVKGTPFEDRWKAVAARRPRTSSGEPKRRLERVAAEETTPEDSSAGGGPLLPAVRRPTDREPRG